MLKISFLKFYLIAFLLSISLYSAGNTKNEFPLDPAITYGKLENGLTYYIRENQTPKDKVSIKLIIKTGSVMEEDHQLGLAHLLEHMAFNGSKNFPKRKIDEYMSSIGLNLGSHYNAYTSYIETSYDFEIPTKNKEDVEVAIKILADISKNLSLEPEAFERERKIVEEEWRRDIGGTNKYVEEFHKHLFKNSRLLERKPIGTLDVIQNFKYQDAIDYYQKWYQPELMGFLVIGDIETNHIVQTIKDNFGSFKNSQELKIPDYKIFDGSIPMLIIHTLIIAFVGFMEAIAIAKQLYSKKPPKDAKGVELYKNPTPVDSNQELLGQGIANISSSVSGSIPVSGSFSRSAVNEASGAYSGLSSIVTMLVVGVTLLFATPLLFSLPQATLGIIVIFAVIPLIRIKEMSKLYSESKRLGVITWITFGSTLLFPMLSIEIYEGITTHIWTGIIFGFLIHILFFKKQLAD